VIALVRVTSDHPAFRPLTEALDAELRGRYGDVQAQYAPFNHIAGLPTALLAMDGDDAIACGCFRPYDATTVELKRMFVRPDRRGERIAGRLVTELEAWAHELGFTRVLLETGNLQVEAVAAYTRAGYAIIEPFGPYAGMPASICMAKAL